jgi:hypothetical protein
VTLVAIDWHEARPCVTCGHPRMFHRATAGAGCRFELEDWDRSLIRCGCFFYIPISDPIEPGEEYL